MLDGPAAQLAVARLTEAGTAARKYRHDPARPLEGYCLVTGDQQHCRVTIYVENARTLADRRPEGDFYYEGWVVGSSEPISIGAFNTGASGEGSGTCIREAGLLGLEGAAAIRVTAEPLGGSPSGAVAVLEGRLIWLHGEPKAAPSSAGGPAQSGTAPPVQGAPTELALDAAVPPAQDAAPAPAQAAAASPARDAALALTQSAAAPSPGTSLAQEEATASVQDAAPADNLPDPVEADVEAPAEQELAPDEPADFAAFTASEAQRQGFAPTPAVVRTAVGEAEAHTAAVPTASPPSPLQDPHSPAPAADLLTRASAEAASPAELRNPPAQEAEPAETPPPPLLRPATRSITLQSCHPMAPRAVGSAVLHLQEGRISATLRGLPSPVALGRTPGQNRPFNGYRLWLVSQRSGSRLPLGVLTRVWGENYRVEEGPGLPVARYDTLLITADDRTAPSPDPHWPQVMTGSLEPGT